MSLHKNPVLKEAVLHLPQKEKDKLLIRLISKDKMLMKQLHYQLLEDETDLESRIQKLKSTLETIMEEAKRDIKDIPTFGNYRNLTLLLRNASGHINEHEKVTKDKFSEAEFRLYLLKRAFQHFPKLYAPTAISAGIKLHKYAIGRVKNANSKFTALHEDLQFDLSEDMTFILDFADNHQLL